MPSEEHNQRKNDEPPADSDLERRRGDTDPVDGLPKFLPNPEVFSGIIGMGRGRRKRVVRGGDVSWIEELGGEVNGDKDNPAGAITQVNLRDRPVRDEDLARLASLGSLQVLDLAYTPITDAGLLHLSSLIQLRVLYLSGTGITDMGLTHLEKLLNLEELELHGTSVKDAGLMRLTALKNLRDLVLAFTEITDDGLMVLHELKNLEALDVLDTQVTRRAANELKKSLPSLVIRGLLGK